MPSSAQIKSLVSFKLPNFAEIELTLFENCDVACSFCAHDKGSVVGMSYSEILSKIDIVSSYIDSLEEDVTSVHLHMVGGELLQDKIFSSMPDILKGYEAIAKSFKNKLEEKNLSGKIFIVTNLLSKSPKKISNWLNKHSIKLIASYDSTGRPLGDQYFKNIEIFKKNIANFNMVATKTTLKKIINGDPGLDYIYQNFDIFMDDFLPDKKNQYLIPDDNLFLDFLTIVKNKYPKLLPYGPLMEKVGSASVENIQFATFNKCTVLPNNKVTNYLWDRHKSEDFITTVDKADNSNMLWNFLNHNNCFGCEHYRYCPLRCPVSWSWKNTTHNNECVNKTFFDQFKAEV